MKHFELERDAHLTKTCIQLVVSARTRSGVKRGKGRTLGPLAPLAFPIKIN